MTLCNKVCLVKNKNVCIHRTFYLSEFEFLTTMLFLRVIKIKCYTYICFSYY